jgi:hypothetical protein
LTSGPSIWAVKRRKHVQPDTQNVCCRNRGAAIQAGNELTVVLAAGTLSSIASLKTNQGFSHPSRMNDVHVCKTEANLPQNREHVNNKNAKDMILQKKNLFYQSDIAVQQLPC